MSDLIQRDYYKIFTGTNEFGGYDKIHLGYNAETTEVDLIRDKNTYFHMPFFAAPQSINESSLVADGAIPGPIPDLADRIYKKLGNYGETTPWGTPSERSDGTWLCSWLYAEGSEPPIWLDRYYNPGRISYKEALEGEANFNDYIKNDPIYFDIVSTLVLEPGVLYQYFHQGEDTSIKYVETFAGINKKNLRLDIEDWSCLCPDKDEPIDRSIYNNTVAIENFKNDWIINPFDPGHRDRNALSFVNNDFIDCRVLYSTNYNLNNEFTLTFWVNNPDWSEATSTQLIGNLRLGGFGVFYNNLNNNPFFAIPETTYGHLFYFNQEGDPYLDKNIQSTLGQPSTIVSSHINSELEIITVDITPNENRVFKYNHVGDRLTFSKTLTGGRQILEGVPKVSILGANDELTVITTLSTYTFNKDLLLLSISPADYSAEDKLALAYNLNGELHYELLCIDVKFDSYNKKWHINEQGNLFYDDIFVSYIPSNNETGNGTNTNLAIDPENNLWVLADSNTVYKIDTLNLQIIGKFEIGVLTPQIKSKNIGFIKTYFRNTNSFTWYAVIYHNFEKTAYQVTLEGKIFKVTYLPPLLNTLDPVISLQNKELLTYTSKGDFTGYETRRIFNKLIYNNNPQIQFKVSVNPSNQLLPNSIYNLSVPVQYLTDNDWHLITVTLKNQNISLYINNVLRSSLQIPGSVNFTYDYKNDLYIGTPCGKTGNYNTEILSQGSIWNGYIDTVKIYDYAIESKYISYFIREKTFTSDIEWNIPTASLPYVEVIDRFFKHRLPGHKSNFFNVRLTGTKITDPLIRQRIENEIKTVIEQIKPAYTELFKVEWID
jgi:hypothetical protein